MSAATGPQGFDDVIEILESLPAIIRETRRRKNLSVRAAAAELKVAHASLLNWERYTQAPSVDMAVRILKWAAS